MTVVADAGPLMALAKIGALEVLFRIFPKILTPPAVHHELITAGLRLAERLALLSGASLCDHALALLDRQPI